MEGFYIKFGEHALEGIYAMPLVLLLVVLVWYGAASAVTDIIYAVKKRGKEE